MEPSPLSMELLSMKLLSMKLLSMKPLSIELRKVSGPEAGPEWHRLMCD
jgi:hypothetical protein